MTPRLRRIRSGLAAATVLALTAAACGGDGNDENGSGRLSGQIVISGSSTVEPITNDVAERFSDENPSVAIDVSGPGTGDGFELFCAGETDISNASRAIKQEEADACADAGIEYVELKIGIDGLAVITSPANDELACLSFEQLYGLLGPESEGFDDWSDANALIEEIGGEGNLPDAPLEVTAPGEESGTYDTFVEIVFTSIFKARVEAGVDAVQGLDSPEARADYTSSPNDNVIVDGVSGHDTSLGWVGVAFADANADVVRKLAIDGGDGCVENTPEATADGSYPIARPLFFYVNPSSAADNPALAAYVDFFLSDEGLEAVPATGYVALPDADIEATRSAWTEAKA